MSAALIYKTTSPAAARILDELDAQKEAALAATDGYTRQVAAEIGPGKDGERRVLVGAGRQGSVWGVEKVPGEETPRGWLDKGRYLAPDRRLKTGKAHAATLHGIKMPAADNVFTSLGMASAVMVGDRFYQPGFVRDGGAVYVYWGSRDVEEKVDEERARHYSGTGVEWTTIPRSEWFALAEARGWVDA